MHIFWYGVEIMVAGGTDKRMDSGEVGDKQGYQQVQKW